MSGSLYQKAFAGQPSSGNLHREAFVKSIISRGELRWARRTARGCSCRERCRIPGKHLALSAWTRRLCAAAVGDHLGLRDSKDADYDRVSVYIAWQLTAVRHLAPACLPAVRRLPVSLARPTPAATKNLQRGYKEATKRRPSYAVQQCALAIV